MTDLIVPEELKYIIDEIIAYEDFNEIIEDNLEQLYIDIQIDEPIEESWKIEIKI